MKGHKRHCPFRNTQDELSKCKSTRNRKSAQTTEQQQQLHIQGGLEGEVASEGSGRTAVPVRLLTLSSEYPRLQELLEETTHILDEDLFQKIDKLLPKITNP